MRYLLNIATIEAYPEKCTGCGMCMHVCPHQIFRMKDKKVEIIDRDACMECGACVVNCAFGALSVDKGVGCAAAVINGMISGGEPSCDCGGGKKSCC